MIYATPCLTGSICLTRILDWQLRVILMETLFGRSPHVLWSAWQFLPHAPRCHRWAAILAAHRHRRCARVRPFLPHGGGASSRDPRHAAARPPTRAAAATATATVVTDIRIASEVNRMLSQKYLSIQKLSLITYAPRQHNAKSEFELAQSNKYLCYVVTICYWALFFSRDW